MLFNIFIQYMNESLETVPTQRKVFLVKNLVQVLQSSSDSTSVKTEIFKALSAVLKHISEVYGSHWGEVMQALIDTWEVIDAGDPSLPVLHSSLRLFAVLRSLVETDPNDDLVDAWRDSKQKLFDNLVSTLSKLGMSTLSLKMII